MSFFKIDDTHPINNKMTKHIVKSLSNKEQIL